MKRVLFIAHVESHILHFHLPFLKIFQDNGYETHVATNGKEIIPYCNIQHNICFERSPLYINNIKAFHELRKLLNETEFDIIHCHTPVGGVLGRLAWAHSKNKEIAKIFYTAHGFHFYNKSSSLNWLLYYPIEKYLAKYTDVLLTINEEDYINAQQFHLHNNGKVYKINGVGIDINAIDKIVVNPVSVRAALRLSLNDVVLITVGELNKNKNQEIILKAMHRSNNPNLKLLICGKGKYETKLQRLIHDLKLQNQVFMLGYRTDIIELLKIADVFVFPSHREGLSVAAMQAIACNKICFLSEIRGNIDLNVYGSNIYYFDENKPEELTQLLNQIQNIKIKPRTDKIMELDIHNIISEMKNIYGLK